jgi:multicomponent K+:H+ antiporter subunit G
MNALPLWLDVLIAFFMVSGAVFALIGAWGLCKLGDFMKRLHGPTKASTLGVGGVLLGSMGWFAWSGGSSGPQELLITLFIFVTAPISAHMLVKGVLAGRE